MACRDALVLIVALLLTRSLHAQPASSDFCQEALLKSRPTGPDSYARRLGYCDGAVFKPNAGSGELPVIGVVAGPIGGDPASAPLILSAVPAAQPGEPDHVLWLQGFAKSPDANYRLDATLFRDQRLSIGKDSAMPRTSPVLTAKDVAWAAWAESSQYGKTYYPVVSAGPVWPYVEITVRPTIRVASINYTIADSLGGIVVKNTPLQGPARLGDPVSFTVPAGSPALVVARVVAVGNTGKTQVASIRFYRPKAH
jgi:hypothetical protein